MKVLKIQRKNLLNMKMVVSYFNFVFFIEVKAKSKHRILNFVFQFIENTIWHFWYTDSTRIFNYLIQSNRTSFEAKLFISCMSLQFISL